MIDGRPITAPYEFVVIGDPQDMETAMNIPGGVVQASTRRGGSVDIAQSDEVVVDALRPLDTPQYASPDDRRLTDRLAPPYRPHPSSRRRSPHGHAGRPPLHRPARVGAGAGHRRHGDRRAGRDHRPRPGRARRHRLRPAARGRRRGRPRDADRRGRVHQVGLRRLRPGRRRRGRRQRPRWPTRPRRSTPTPTARAGWWRSACRARAGTRSAACSTPTPTRRWSTRPDGTAGGPGDGGDHYDRARDAADPGDQPGTTGSSP